MSGRYASANAAATTFCSNFERPYLLNPWGIRFQRCKASAGLVAGGNLILVGRKLLILIDSEHKNLRCVYFHECAPKQFSRGKSMRKLGFTIALSCAAAGFSWMAAAESLKASDCRPLTGKNAAVCCAAANWNTVVRSVDQDICRKQRLGQPLGAMGESGTPANPPGTPNPPDTSSPPETADKGINNGFGNGDQDAPGNSLGNNNAENDAGGRGNPSGSPNSTN
jgi:hypothetical protein